VKRWIAGVVIAQPVLRNQWVQYGGEEVVRKLSRIWFARLKAVAPYLDDSFAGMLDSMFRCTYPFYPNGLLPYSCHSNWCPFCRARLAVDMYARAMPMCEQPGRTLIAFWQRSRFSLHTDADGAAAVAAAVKAGQDLVTSRYRIIRKLNAAGAIVNDSVLPAMGAVILQRRHLLVVNDVSSLPSGYGKKGGSRRDYKLTRRKLATITGSVMSFSRAMWFAPPDVMAAIIVARKQKPLRLVACYGECRQ